MCVCVCVCVCLSVCLSVCLCLFVSSTIMWTSCPTSVCVHHVSIAPVSNKDSAALHFDSLPPPSPPRHPPHTLADLTSYWIVSEVIRTQKSSVLLTEKPELSDVISIKLRGGQPIATYASPAARNFSSHVHFYRPDPFSFTLFPNPLPRFALS